MRFLVDNALSPIIARALSDDGHDAVHLRDLGLASASDEEVFRIATDQDRIVVSADTDFGTILAHQQTAHPSVILLRRQRSRKPSSQARLIIENLPSVAEALGTGALVVIEPTRIRVRKLPIAPNR